MMQTCLRNGGLTRYSILGPHAGSSRTVWQSSRNYASSFNPLGWVKEKVSPQLKEKQSKEEVEAAKKQAAAQGTQSVFDIEPATIAKSKKEDLLRFSGKKGTGKDKPTEHKYSTAEFKMSHRKLNMLANQIGGKPIDWAILQMQFSEKRVSTRIMNMLATAKDHASRYKHLDRSKLIVSEAWVTKGKRGPRKIEPRGRNHYGVRHHPNSKMTVVLREGKTMEEKKAERREKILKRIVSPSVMREDVPLRNPSPTWCW